jgi:glycosyltransferase involved in cell wall biosynthesis
MNRTIYVLAENFSNDKRESFFEKELPYLSQAFDKVYVIPLYPDGSNLLNSEKNIEVLDFNFFQPCNRIRVLLSNLLPIARIWFFELARTHHKGFYIRKFRTNLNDLIYKFSASEKLEALVRKDINTETVFYSYWFMQWMTALSMIKLKHPDMKIVSRVHGADYDEEQIKRPLPFRYFQLSKVNRMFPVSAFAKKYLVKRFKLPAEKAEVSRLGLLLNEASAPCDQTNFHIVSCSSLIPLKRVHLIIEILKNIPGEVSWTHFGDGPTVKDVKKKAASLGPNVMVDFKGYVSNLDFLTYLKQKPVSLFINVSESEGIPVTLMEATSFGIPVAGPAICGVPEIVTQQTGYLFPKDFDPKELATLLYSKHNEGILYDPAFRNKIREFYKTHFYAPLNYKTLAESLTHI